MSSGDADRVIADQIAYYRSFGAAVEWKVYAHDTPADLLERLERHGFAIGARETVLVLDLCDRPGWISEAPPPGVVRVENADQVAQHREAAEQIFGKSYAFTATELLAGIRDGSTQHRGYMVVEGNTAVSIGRLYTHPDSMFGGLYGGATLEQHRGRGLYRATVAARARDAAELGARYLIVDALPASRVILERLGFARLTETWACTLIVA